MNDKIRAQLKLDLLEVTFGQWQYTRRNLHVKVAFMKSLADLFGAAG